MDWDNNTTIYKFFEFRTIDGIIIKMKFIGGVLLETIGKSSCT